MPRSGCRRHRPPEVLRRAYGNRVRRILDAVLYLLPSPPRSPDSSCPYGRCLRCVPAAERKSWLVRHGDPDEYRQLLTRGFAVFRKTAPALPADFDPRPLHDQRQPVDASTTLDNLSDSAWHLLLMRIGDVIMLHLLKFSSIFLPLLNNKYYEVNGSSRSDFYPHYTKAKETEVHMQTFSPKNAIIQGLKNSTGVKNVKCMRDSGDYIPGDSANARKRTRPSSWQRRRKRRNTSSYTSDTNLVHCERKLSSPDNNVQCSELLTCSSNKGSHEYYMKREIECPLFSLLEKSTQNESRKAGIDKRPLFYNTALNISLFSRQHILNKVKPNDKGARAVMENILLGASSSCFYSSMKEFCAGERRCLCRSFLKLIKSLIKNVKRCQFRRILSKHCLTPSLGLSDEKSLQTKKAGTKSLLFRTIKAETKNSCMISIHKLSDVEYLQTHKVKEPKQESTLSADRSADLTRPSCSHASVASFIWAICRSIIPQDLLGGPSTWRTLTQRISDFVKLRRFEKFYLKQCTIGIKTLDIPFLARFKNLDHGFNHEVQITLKAKFFRKWIFWLFSNVVVPLVAAHFYVTETSHCGNDVSYYPKHLWKNNTDKAIRTLCEHRYRRLESPLSYFQNRTLGFSKVRFLPKKSGLRTLINLKAQSNVIFSRGKVVLKGKPIKKKRSMDMQVFNYGSVNFHLRDLHIVLKRMKANQPEMLGSSVFDYNDIYKKLYPFIISIRNRFMTTPDFFIFACDVRKAFDNIDQDKLLQIIDAILQRGKYVLREYPYALCTKKGLWVCSDRIALDSDYSTSITRHKDILPNNSSHGVIFDEFSCKEIERSVLLRLLHEHIKGNVVQFGQHLWLQSVGISQGSILSPLLCSFYYAHLEKSVIFPLLEKTRETFPAHTHCSLLDQDVTSSPECLMMRLIDDFLFISTSKMQSQSLYCRLQRGISDYNCYMNGKKFYTNFDINEPLRNKRVYVGDDGIPFIPWSGLLLNCQTLEIQADYTRYCTSKMSSRITVSSEAQANCQLKSKLCDYMRPKCHALFYDSNINSPGIVRLNAYQAFLVCAMKFHCLMVALPKSWELSPTCLLGIIEMSFRYMFRLIKNRMSYIKFACDSDPVLNLKKEEVCFLALSAYIRILEKKQTRHSELLRHLRLRLRKYSHLLTGDDMSYAIDDCHSSMFWKIKF